MTNVVHFPISIKAPVGSQALHSVFGLVDVIAVNHQRRSVLVTDYREDGAVYQREEEVDVTSLREINPDKDIHGWSSRTLKFNPRTSMDDLV